jgi:hypothetical protein
MNPNELYKLWAPEASIWSNWAKPILFTEAPLGDFHLAPDWRSFQIGWAPAGDAGTGIILDLPGADGVWMGLALAARGFRPVPLYDGAPGFNALIEVGPIIGALQKAAPDLSQMPLAPDAPPVFLLDSRRGDSDTLVSPGKFDNRWAIFPQDFPSANFLLSRGIRAIVLGQQTTAQPRPDLAHTLLRWQEAGIRILACAVLNPEAPEPLQITRPGRFRKLWYRALVLAGLRRNSTGGFGGVVPEPSHGGAG